jgi:hypothetical protein
MGKNRYCLKVRVTINLFWMIVQTTDSNVYQKKVRVGTVQYFKWIEGFTTDEKSIKINLIPVTVSQ